MNNDLLILILRAMFMNCIWMGNDIIKNKFSEMTGYKAQVDIYDCSEKNTKCVSYKNMSIVFKLNNGYISDINLNVNAA